MEGMPSDDEKRLLDGLELIIAVDSYAAVKMGGGGVRRSGKRNEVQESGKANLGGCYSGRRG